MKHSKLKFSTVLLLTWPLLLMALLAAGCSTDNYAPITGSAEVSSFTEEFRYPVLTEELLAAGPAPGFRFVRTRAADAFASLDANPCDSMADCRFVERRRGKKLKIDHLVEVKIDSDQLPRDTTVTVIAPVACYAVIDCYPHPLQFSGMVEIKWKVKDLDLPDDFDYSTLVPWYIADDGQFVPVEHEWRGNYKELIVRTDHFSRYIIGQRVG